MTDIPTATTAPATDTPPTMAADPSTANNPNVKILVVEDEPDLLSLYSSLLTQQGYAVQAANNGQDALILMKGGGYDLVLLDIMLPKMDGLQILETLWREPPKTPNKA